MFSDPELQDWGRERGFKINKYLDLFDFPTTGRGFVSKG